MSASRQDKVFLLMGASQVGKSALSACFRGLEFEDSIAKTKGVVTRPGFLKDQQCSLLILDMSANKGDGGYERLLQNCIRPTDRILVCYDITSKLSFDAVDDYVAAIRKNRFGNRAPIYLVGLKADLAENYVVDEGDAKAKAKKLEIEFFGEVSAKDKTNISALLDSLVGPPTQTVENESSPLINRAADSYLDVSLPTKTVENEPSSLPSTQKQKPSIFARAWSATKSFLSRHWPELMVGALVLAAAVTLAVVFWPVILGSAAVSFLAVPIVAAVKLLGFSVSASAMIPGVAVAFTALSIAAATINSVFITAGVRKLIDRCSRPKQVALSLDESDSENEDKKVTTTSNVTRLFENLDRVSDLAHLLPKKNEPSYSYSVDEKEEDQTKKEEPSYTDSGHSMFDRRLEDQPNNKKSQTDKLTPRHSQDCTIS